MGVNARPVCLFPLRTNAAFYREHGRLDLRQRVKEATLLYETVVLEDGVYSAVAGPTRSLEMLEPASDEVVDNLRRLKPRGGTFSLALRHDATGARRVLAASERAERRFVAEYHSIVREFLQDTGTRELPPWISLAPFALTPSVQNRIGALAREDARRPGFWRRGGSSHFRDVVLKNLNHDLLLSACLEAFVSLDGYFSPLVRRKRGVESGKGVFALRVLFPNFGSLGWKQVMEVRDHPGIADFRAKLAEIEEEALAQVDGTSSASEAVHRRAMIDLAQGWRPPRLIDEAGKIAVDLAIGLIPVIGPPASALLDVAQADQERRTWGAVFLRLLEMTGSA